MNARYCYSLNGENYFGEFETREFALATAIDQARKQPEVPGTVYVAQRIPANTHAAGHAGAVVQRMIEQSRNESADSGGSFLRTVKPGQVQELDRQLQECILGWLTRQRLLPTRFHVEAISEHAVPLPAGFHSIF